MSTIAHLLSEVDALNTAAGRIRREISELNDDDGLVLQTRNSQLAPEPFLTVHIFDVLDAINALRLELVGATRALDGKPCIAGLPHGWELIRSEVAS